MSVKTCDVLLIGSGISCLTSALLLAKKGKRVLVLEQYSKPGGYMHCYTRFNERYDTGAHYIGAMDPGDPFHTLLSYLGVYDDKLFIPLDPHGFDEFHFPEFSFAIPKGYAEVARALTQEFPGEGAAIDKFLAMIRRAVTFFPTYEFNDQHNEMPSAEIFETSLAAVVQGLTSNPRLQCVLYSYCALHGVEPQDIAFGFHAIILDSLIRSPYGLRTGGDALTTRFVDEIRRLGGEVLTCKKVTKLAVKDRQVQGIETADGDAFTADWVIAGIHPKAAFALVDDQSLFPAVFTQRLASLRESVGLLGISALIPQGGINSLRNYFYFDSSDPSRFLAINGPDQIPSAAFLSPARRQEVPGRAQPLNLHSPGPIAWFEPWRDTKWSRRGDDYKRKKEAAAENVFRLVERYRPGFRASISRYTVSTPLTNLHFNGSAEGSAYGLYHSIQNTGPRAIGPRTKVLNLLLTGQNALVPGLLGAAISGLRSSGHIVGIKPILTELKELGANA